VVAQLKELADLVGIQRDVRMKPAHERMSGSFGRTTRGHASALVDNDLRDATDLVSKAADTIAEMARRNQELEAAASRAVLHYKSEAESSNKRNIELGSRLESLENDFQMQVNEFQSRLEDLQSRLTSTIASLEEKTRDAEFANEWLVYLSTEIRQRLSDAPSKLAEMSRDVRARRFEFQLD
jgi:chromosome segregation ATPase